MRRSRILVALALPALLSAGSPVAGAGPLAQTTIDEIRAFVTASFDELSVPGAAVVVVDADGILYAEGFGTIDDADTPVTPQTRFHLASAISASTPPSTAMCLGSAQQAPK